MLPTTPRTEPQQTGEHRHGESVTVEHRTQVSSGPRHGPSTKAHLVALARYGSLGLGHRYAVAGLTGLLRMGERVIWRARRCSGCSGRGWVPYLYAIQACGCCEGTGFEVGS